MKDNRTLSDLIGQGDVAMTKDDMILGAVVLKRMRAQGFSRFDEFDILSKNALLETHVKNLSYDKKNSLFEQLIMLIFTAGVISAEDVIIACRDRIDGAVRKGINADISVFMRRVKKVEDAKRRRHASALQKQTYAAQGSDFLTVAA